MTDIMQSVFDLVRFQVVTLVQSADGTTSEVVANAINRATAERLLLERIPFVNYPTPNRHGERFKSVTIREVAGVILN